MDTLPAWLQWLVSLATVLSSIGVIIAFVQLRISGNQFHEQLKISTDQFQTQLKLTQNQFKLINQGFVKLTMMQYFLPKSDDSASIKEIPLDPNTLYIGGNVKLT